MALFDVHPWMRFATGLVTGLWAGVAFGCVLAMLLAGRRLRQLESANLLLRVKLRARERAKRMGIPSPVLVPNPGAMGRPATGTMNRYASGSR